MSKELTKREQIIVDELKEMSMRHTLEEMEDRLKKEKRE